MPARPACGSLLHYAKHHPGSAPQTDTIDTTTATSAHTRRPACPPPQGPAAGTYTLAAKPKHQYAKSVSVVYSQANGALLQVKAKPAKGLKLAASFNAATKKPAFDAQLVLKPAFLSG
jgi:hypothetical protein